MGGVIGRVQIPEPTTTTKHLDGANLSDPDGPIGIESFSLRQRDVGAQEVSVDVSVVNRSDAAATGRVQWLISRLGDLEPWKSPYWRTGWSELLPLGPNESRTVHWTSTIGLPEGTYGGSTWVHAQQGATWAHSHASSAIPIELEPNTSGVHRSGPPAGHLLVAEATMNADQLSLRVSNLGDESALFSLLLAPLAEQRRYDWHLQPSAPMLQTDVYRIPPRGTTVVHTPPPGRCAPERALVRVMLMSQPFQPAAEALDDVAVNHCG